MTMLILLMASFGVTFGLQNKVPWLQRFACAKPTLLRRLLQQLLSCPYCLGFWTGWLVWGASMLMGIPLLIVSESTGVMHGVAIGVEGLVMAFSSAVFCYLMYVLIVWLEDSLEK